MDLASASVMQAVPELVLPVQALTQAFVLPVDVGRAVPASGVPLVTPEASSASVAALQASLSGQLASAFQTPALTGNQRQGFRIGSVGLMIGHEDGSELTEMPTLYDLPHAPTWFIGMANLHGNMVPVFDLASYLGIEKQPVQREVARRMLLVLGHGAEAAGVMIDGLPQRLNWSARQQTDSDTAPSILLPHVKAACFIDGQLWFDMDCGSLLESLENAMKLH